MATVSGVELTIAGMRVVREVAAHGSFTGAADALGYTQSAISRQVAAMELAAGSPLFERHARGVRPTAAGVILLRHAATVLQGVEAAQLELTGMDQRLAGRLAVGVFPAALGVVVPRALAALRAGHPAIDIRLREGTTPAHLRRLRAGALDIAVIGAGPDLAYELEGLTVDELLTGDLLLAVGAAHRFAGLSWVPVAELEAEEWIVGDAATGGPQFGPWPTLTGQPQVRHAVRDWTARLGLVAAGLGVSVLPVLLRNALPPGVVAVRVEDPRPWRRALVAVRRHAADPGAAAFVAALRACAADLSAA
jgi:DNA-binding transcriptional LysR family regulator